jgi:hypothetical protein
MTRSAVVQSLHRATALVPMTPLHVDPPFRALPDDPSRVIAASHDFYYDDVVLAASRPGAAHA